MDFPGLWQHFTIPAEELDEQTFEEGKGFDGSSIRGWVAINESDMLVKPAPDTAFIDPFCKDKTLTMICNIHDPLTGEEYTRDPRNVARKAANYLKSSGVADRAGGGQADSLRVGVCRPDTVGTPTGAVRRDRLSTHRVRIPRAQDGHAEEGIPVWRGRSDGIGGPPRGGAAANRPPP